MLTKQLEEHHFQMADTKEDSFKIGFGLWLSLCLVLCIWFLSSFIKGRRQFQNNLHVIEDGLRRMQEEMEFKQRQNSVGYVENMEEITALLHKMKDSEINKEV
ncbi:hypothetical protein NQ314_002036 [Rhamnusium bicolor]|uniref:Uncharacterized protein n=1 Tax=Rhamnusium bicolor TaxID=1586634 RepID=A0AAV8ZRJ5_9CUCU|nr:hypothetical protein NQ314_002036 [Rhamnusium bicolor]